MMQNIFTRKIRFKDDSGKDFPEWVTSKLEDIGDVKTSSVDKLLKKGEASVKLLNYMDVYRRDHIYISDKFQCVTATERERSSFNLRRGDILFTPSSETPTDIGHSAVVMEDLNDVLYSYHLIRFRPHSEIFVGGFGGYVFKSYNFYKELWRRAQGATRFTLSLESLKEAVVSYPESAEEQQKITDLLTTVDKAITSKLEEISQIEEWKKGLVQKMYI
jgi:type I restriction enzyme S subunit